MKRVKFIGCSNEQAKWGGCNDPRKYLDVNEIFEVVGTEVHKWHTKLMLKGQEGLKFNSVCFVDCIGSPGEPIDIIGGFTPWKASDGN